MVALSQEQLMAVARADPKTLPQGPIGMGRQLVRCEIDEYRTTGFPLLCALIQPPTSQFVLT
jgi:hypothetical protein